MPKSNRIDNATLSDAYSNRPFHAQKSVCRAICFFALGLILVTLLVSCTIFAPTPPTLSPIATQIPTNTSISLPISGDPPTDTPIPSSTPEETPTSTPVACHLTNFVGYGFQRVSSIDLLAQPDNYVAGEPFVISIDPNVEFSSLYLQFSAEGCSNEIHYWVNGPSLPKEGMSGVAAFNENGDYSTHIPREWLIGGAQLVFDDGSNIGNVLYSPISTSNTPTFTLKPSNPPKPTDTPEPPEPTDTPEPPEPTDTPEPPEPTDTPEHPCEPWPDCADFPTPINEG